MEKKLIQEQEHLSEHNFTPFSKPDFSQSEFLSMQKVLIQIAENFSEYLENSKEPIRFTDNVIPLKQEFVKFTLPQDNSLSLFGEI